MRTLLVFVVIILLLALGGWLVFDISGNRAAVEVRTEKIQEDTNRLLENAKDTFHKADDGIDKMINPKE